MLAISADHPFTQKAFAASLQLPFPLLSDYFGLGTTKSYGVVYGTIPGQKVDYPEMTGRIPKRAFFLIDREGIVRGKWFGEDLAVFPTDVLIEAARTLAAKR